MKLEDRKAELINELDKAIKAPKTKNFKVSSSSK